MDSSSSPAQLAGGDTCPPPRGVRALRGPGCRIDREGRAAQRVRNAGQRDPGQGSEPSEMGVATLEPQLKRPPRRRVIMLNDDYTPMEFVVALLVQVFGLDQERATRIMLQVHTKGSGVCGVYTAEVAEALCNEANATARAHEHPLTCETEPVEDDD